MCAAETGRGTDTAISGRRLTLTAEGTAEKNMLLLPVAYHKGFHVNVNGEEQTACEVLGAFTAVPIKEGKNVIEITFVPDGIMAGMCLACAGMLSVLAAVLLRRRYAVTAPGPVQQAAAVCFWTAFAVIGIFVYVIPSAANFAAFILKIAL